jgi:hypothetical protein
MANPRGQQRDKPFRDALRMELAAIGDDHKALRMIARSLIAAASEGKMDAIKEIGDRMDGKPAQAVIGGDEDDPAINMIHRIERMIVNAPNTNG